jgi:hypothetical protein
MYAPLPVEIPYAIRIPLWRALFAAHGCPPGMTTVTTSSETIATALSISDLPLALARALFTIAAFSTEAALPVEKRGGLSRSPEARLTSIPVPTAQTRLHAPRTTCSTMSAQKCATIARSRPQRE